MEIEEAKNTGRVAYVPNHIVPEYGKRENMLWHEEVERGTISSYNDKYIFVKFDKQVNVLGWNETTAQSCYPEDLVIL